MEGTGCPKLSVKDNKRVSHTLFTSTATCSTTVKRKSVQHGSFGCNDVHNHPNATPGCIRCCQGLAKFCVHNVSCAKGRRVAPTHLQPSCLEQLRNHRQVQINKCSSSPRLPSTKGLDVQNRPVTGLFSPSRSSISQTVPTSNLRREINGNDVPPVRSEHGSQGICLPIELGSSVTQGSRDSNNRLLRRLSGCTSKPTDITDPCPNHGREVAVSRLVGEFRQVHTHTLSMPSLPGCSVEHSGKRKVPSREKVPESKVQDIDSPSRESSRFEGFAEPSRSIKFCKFSCTKGQASLSSTPLFPEYSRQDASCQTVHDSGTCPERVNLVVAEPHLSFSDSLRASNAFPSDRCLRPSLGSATRRPFVHGAVERTRTTDTLQPEGTSSITEDITGPGSVSVSFHGSMAVRQQNSRCFHSQGRRHEINSSLGLNNRYFQGSRSLSNSPSRSSHSRQIQLTRRSSVSLPIPPRMAPFAGVYRPDFQQIRGSGNRFVCVEKCACGGQLCVSGPTRRPSPIPRRFFPDLELPPSVAFSSSIFDPQGTHPSQPGQGPLSVSGASVGTGLLESRSQIPSASCSFHNQASEPPSSRHLDGPSTSQSTGNDARSMEMWGWSHSLNDWNRSQLDLLSSSWRPSTRSTYKAAWHRWLGWCNKEKADPCRPTGSILAKFLADLYLNENLSYNTILLHKSVVSTLCNTEISGVLSAHVLVKHVMKSIALRKPVPHKKTIWDVNVLISYLSSYEFNENNCFATARHTAMLLLLVSGRRIHDLTLLAVNQEHYIDNTDHIILWPRFGSKTDRSDFRQSGWKLLRNENIKNLDPVFWVKQCIKLFNQKRNSLNNYSLFVNLRSDTKAASRTVIAGWVKSLLSEAGIIAAPGSVRSAVASRSWADNVSVDEILLQGNWRSGDTFRRFYRREVVQAPVSSGISNCFRPI